MKESNDFTTSLDNPTDSIYENIAIIGLNRVGNILYKTVNENLHSHQKLVGFIKEYSKEINEESSEYSNILGYLENLDSIINENKISCCIIAIDPRDVQKLHFAIEICEKEGIKYFLVSSYYDVVYGGTLKEILKKVKHLPKLNLRYFFDFLISIVSILLFFPSFLLIVLCIKLSSRGSIFCSDERVGKDENIFRYFKFRTCYDTSKIAKKTLSSIGEEPRLTRCGTFLKRTRLEDIPVLLNVLRGDLSIIGPRVENPYFHQKYKREIPFYQNRLRAKPGLISLAYVEIATDSLIEDVREKLKYDLFYIDHQKSIKVNLKILIKSNLMVFFSKSE